MHYDLLIIGTGLSGLMAAKAAVDLGKKILILGKGIGSLSLFSNSIDLLGPSQQGRTMEENLSLWIKNHPDHPYSKVGLKGIEDSLSSFLSLFPPPYSFMALGRRNSLIPTAAGTLRPTYLIPETMAEGVSFPNGKTLIVGIKGYKDFYPHYVADQMKCRGITISLTDFPNPGETANALARLMEKKSFRQEIASKIKEHFYGESRIGFPALLGLHNPMEVKDDLERLIGTKIFEIPTLPPSIPGMRIFYRFKEWLAYKGVPLLLGSSVKNGIIKGKRCVAIHISHPPLMTTYSADRYLLATGRFTGGGLWADRERISEPIFNLPVKQPETREEWFRSHFFDSLSHPIHQTGIMVNSSFQPIDEGGNLILENVWVAGTILAHHNWMDEKSREGIEIATGYMAARYALST